MKLISLELKTYTDTPDEQRVIYVNPSHVVALSAIGDHLELWLEGGRVAMIVGQINLVAEQLRQ